MRKLRNRMLALSVMSLGILVPSVASALGHCDLEGPACDIAPLAGFNVPVSGAGFAEGPAHAWMTYGSIYGDELAVTEPEETQIDEHFLDGRDNSPAHRRWLKPLG